MGDWENDEFNGKGSFNFPENANYISELKDNDYHFEGISTMSFGTYVGEFKEGKYNGNGVLTLPDGRIIEGKFKDNFLRKFKFRDE